MIVRALVVVAIVATSASYSTSSSGTPAASGLVQALRQLLLALADGDISSLLHRP